jgi:hypothetical protein
MTFSSLRMGLLAAALALPLGFAGAATAQDAPPPAAGGPDAAHGHWDPAQRQQMIAQHPAMMAQRLSDILQLTPAQQPALQTYLAAARPPGDMHHGDQPKPDEHLTAPQRMDRMLAHFDEMRTRLVARADATKAFYAQLSPEQQKAFDDLGPMLMHHGMGDHGGMRGMRGAPGGGGHQPMGPDGQPS